MTAPENTVGSQITPSALGNGWHDVVIGTDGIRLTASTVKQRNGYWQTSVHPFVGPLSVLIAMVTGKRLSLMFYARDQAQSKSAHVAMTQFIREHRHEEWRQPPDSGLLVNKTPFERYRTQLWIVPPIVRAAMRRHDRDANTWVGLPGDSAVDGLTQALVGASLLCTTPFATAVKSREPDPNKAELLNVRVLYEFQFAFLHLTQRAALTLLGDTKRSALIDRLFPLIAESTEHTLFRDWPQHLKDGMRRDFLANASAAELQYASCPSLFDQDQPYTGSGVYSLLARNVASLFDRGTDTSVLQLVLGVTHEYWSKVEIEKRVVMSGPEL